MKTISVFDTNIMAYNIGNEIIMDSVVGQLNEIFSNDFIIRLPIEDIGRTARKYNALSSYTFVGGTNALNGNLRKYRQWDLHLHNILILTDIVLMGCGWFQYEAFAPTKYTRWALSKILHKGIVHSVRDSYTLKKCQELQLTGCRFINTGCPTLWRLTPEHISGIPHGKSDSVVFTLTDYNRDSDRDRRLIEQIISNYTSVYFFPQGTGDISYLANLGFSTGINIIAPRLRAFDALLDNGADYIGTRLHAGIRALQRQARSFIIGIDNRAIEMHNDFNIPVMPAKDIQQVDIWLNSDYSLDLAIPWEHINQWKKQFKNYDI